MIEPRPSKGRAWRLRRAVCDESVVPVAEQVACVTLTLRYIERARRGLVRRRAA